MFIPNHNKSAIINSAHIVSVSISAPEFEQKDYHVVAMLTYGTAILFKGTQDECVDFLGTLYQQLY